MARVGLHGYVESLRGKEFRDSFPVFAYLFDQIDRTLNGQLDATNLADDAVTAAKIDDGAVTAAKLAASSVTSAAVDSTVPKIATGQYTGDGTQDREILLGFRARWVRVLRHDNATRFEAWGGIAAAFASTQIDNAGTVTDGGTDFTGCSTNGFTLGSAAGGGNSNADTVAFSYVALG